MRPAQADHHAVVAWLDGQVGQVLDRLATPALREDTVIVFGSDRGGSLG